MQISDTELKKVMKQGGISLIPTNDGFEPSPREEDKPMIQALTREIIEMTDREDRVTELKARIDAGTYNPSSDEIAEAMIRRTIADRIR